MSQPCWTNKNRKTKKTPSTVALIGSCNAKQNFLPPFSGHNFDVDKGRGAATWRVIMRESAWGARGETAADTGASHRCDQSLLFQPGGPPRSPVPVQRRQGEHSPAPSPGRGRRGRAHPLQGRWRDGGRRWGGDEKYLAAQLYLL